MGLSPLLLCSLAALLTFPANPKQVAEQISVAVSNALNDRHYRISVQTPSSLRFKPQQGKAQLLGDPKSAPPKEWKAAANRELAFILVEIFQTYKHACVVVFPDQSQAKAAKREWAKSNFRPTVLDKFDDLRSSGFGNRAVIVKPKILVLCSPTTRSLQELDSVCTDEMACILLNEEPGCAPPDFLSCYALVDNPHPNWAGGLLYHAYPDGWILGAAGKSGAPKTFGTSKVRPTLEEIDTGFQKVVSDTNWFSGAGAAAALERVK